MVYRARKVLGDQQKPVKNRYDNHAEEEVEDVVDLSNYTNINSSWERFANEHNSNNLDCSLGDDRSVSNQDEHSALYNSSGGKIIHEINTHAEHGEDEACDNNNNSNNNYEEEEEEEEEVEEIENHLEVEENEFEDDDDDDDDISPRGNDVEYGKAYGYGCAVDERDVEEECSPKNNLSKSNCDILC